MEHLAYDRQHAPADAAYRTCHGMAGAEALTPLDVVSPLLNL